MAALGMLATAGLVPLAGRAAPPVAAQTAAPGTIQSVRLDHLASHDLASRGLDGQVKARGQNGDVAVHASTAFVGGGSLFHGAHSSSGRICTDYGGVKVVDIANPSAPVLRTTITIEDTTGVTTRGGQRFDNVSVSAGALDTLTVDTPAFRGDVLAIATQRCEPSLFTGARIEFWDVTSPASPAKLGVFDPATIPNPTPGASPATGAWGIFEDVRMFTRGSRVYAVATTPFSIGNAHDASPFGDFRLLDITDIRKPVQVGTFPPVNIGERSVNGCRTFQAGRAAAPSPDGSHAVLSFYDGSDLLGSNSSAAVFKLDLDNLPRSVPGSSPPRVDPTPSHWDYPPNPAVEGNAADVAPFTGPGGELLTILSEDDIDPALTEVTISAPAQAAGSFRGCEIIVGKKLFEYPGQQVGGPVAYVGRGCPATATVPVADEYLADPAGKLLLVDGGGCTALERLNRARDAGALGIVQSSLSETLSTIIASGNGGYPDLPYLIIPQSGYDRIQYVPNATLAGTTFPTTWERTTSSNVTVVAFPAGSRTDKSRFRSVASATDRLARGQVKAANRFVVVPGQSYHASAFLEVQSWASGAFRAAVVWYDGAGTAVGESELSGLGAVTPRTRYQQTVTAPAGVAKAAVKFEWTGASAEGTAHADSFSMSPVGLQGTAKDNQGEWGAQRILDLSRAQPAEIGSYRSPTSRQWPPPDNGIYGPRLAVPFGDLAFTTWLSDGLRVLDIANPSSPREVGAFVPRAAADPAPQAGAGGGLLRGQVWPNRTLVTGVDIVPNGDSCGLVVISDINAGLHVVAYEAIRAGRQPGCGGYWSAASDGGVFAFGDSRFLGSMGGRRLNSPVVGMAATPSGRGYWLVAADGGIFAFGDAAFYGSTGNLRLNKPVVGMAATPSGKGYWLVAADGGLFAFGDAQFHGSTGALTLNQPVVGAAPTPSGKGYWLVAADGGLFAFGDAAFYGSTGAIRLNRPVVGMAATPSGRGYWLAASDGGIFAFGNAPFLGGTGAIRLNSPMVGMSPTPGGKGYRLVAADGGIFAFGDATFLGSTGSIRLNAPVVGMAGFPR